MRIYGDGSAGAETISADGVLDDLPNLQFTDLTIDPGVTVGAASGTVIRCTGDFTNNGTIVVSTGTSGGFTGDTDTDANTLTYPYQPPNLGWSRRLPTNGESATNNGEASGGLGGGSLDAAQARWLLNPGVFGGGGGGNSSNGAGGGGGGALVIFVQGTFTNNGAIRADGSVGSGNSGGGAGGVIIIASRTTLGNAGTLEAHGASSANLAVLTTLAWGSGGGGGGGIVHLLAPTVTQGTVDVAGGQAGNVVASVSAAAHLGGGGGGACGGNGGFGGDVPAGDPTSPEQGTSGHDGLVIVEQLDPTSLF